ncbi:hypothetical protein [Amaricoccus sp.]|uniref:hypothetical protein n=1 Tax=Amaricoccus sp. TaxID=1872485 RepID=UPI001B5ED62A|nr:hypothetical protein [Amaricoccus sp.]MBP7242133.1 hypothetical protein [Amaricoccus sp.]
MARKASLEQRRDALGARIAAAQARLKAHESGQEDSIGTMLAGFNDELDHIVHEDHDVATQRMNRIEARLKAEEIRIEDDLEDEEG